MAATVVVVVSNVSRIVSAVPGWRGGRPGARVYYTVETFTFLRDARPEDSGAPRNGTATVDPLPRRRILCRFCRVTDASDGGKPE